MAAAGSFLLLLRFKTPYFLLAVKSTTHEIGINPLSKVQNGSNSLLKVQVTAPLKSCSHEKMLQRPLMRYSRTPFTATADSRLPEFDVKLRILDFIGLIV